MARRIFAALFIMAAISIVAAIAQDAPEFGPPHGAEQIRDPKPTAEDIEVQKAVDNGLEYLAGIQNNDGSWSNDVGNKLGNNYQRNIDGIGRPHLGVTAICCMAFMASGHTPDRGEYKRNVAAGLAFVLSNIDRDTGWTSAYGTRMYSHAFCSMFLAEVYGQTRDPVVLSHLRNAISFIVKSQNQQGAWRYIPDQLDSDMSICVCQLQALRAASNVGVLVPKNSIEAARDYVRLSYNHYRSPGSFKYQIDWDDRSTFPLTAAGVVALQSLGNYSSHTYIGSGGQRVTLDLNRSIEYIRDTRPDRTATYLVPGTRMCDYGFWYGHYYAAQAMFQYQYVSPRTWAEWNKLNREHFLKLQHDNGAWTDEIGGWDPKHNAYATAMACLILSIPRGYLPIFQN
ncbi:MAG: terpene cyclase/mutase family protein [Planctomycetes bacterium]|nr:terpene cyclase/mutase family protein [Planctomycetota bacterium]